MADARQPALFNIPAHRDFADALAHGLIEQFGHGPLGLAQGIILVPSNRGAIAIQDAFIRRSEKGLLLPRLVPVGDPDLGEHIGAALDPIDAQPIPPAVDPLERQFILARLLQKSGKFGSRQGAQAMRMAADLGRVLDQLAIECVSPARLREIDTSHLSDHWQASLDQLGTILDQWPRELARLGKIDLAARRNLQLDRLSERWRSVPPLGFVIAAGINTTAPAIANLLREVAQLPQGQVVLAGLDLNMSEAEWEAIGEGEETHPQFQLQTLLSRMGFVRAECELWQWGRDDDLRATRANRIAQALAPARFTGGWEKLDDRRRALAGVAAIELANPSEEAQAIALAMRNFIETPNQTAALITPDRALAERVSAHLKRWEIVADDSAGQALSLTLPGSLLLALLIAATGRFTAVPLLALLKHPLVRAGEQRGAWRDGVRALDLALRGPQIAPDLAGIDYFLSQTEARNRALRQRAAAWWSEPRTLLAPLESAISRGQLAGMITALRETATALCGDGLWAGQAGRELGDLVAAIEQHAAAETLQVDAEGMPQLLRDLLDTVAVRPAVGGHPRLFIWGLVEAQLQRADLVILAGLNEGTWPQLTASDPWLAPAIRRQLGLPGLERRIGVNAHDLASGLSAKQVLMTRARSDGSGPTNASRFWLRLETYANGLTSPSLPFDQLARSMDHEVGERARRPEPCPPVEERPKVISVTEVDGLKADPYAFYAKKMLKLEPLDAPGAEADVKWRGTFLHQVLADWGREDGFATGKLQPRLAIAFEASGLHPVVRALWQPRFAEAAATFEHFVEEGRAEGREPILAEVKGEIHVAGVKLHGRADRIDQLPGNELAVVDYKTGEPPKPKQIKEGFALQLGLLGLLADAGKIEGANGVATRFEYWSQAREPKSRAFGFAKSPCDGKGDNAITTEDFVSDLYQHFEQAVEKWLTGQEPFTAKAHPDYAWSDYDHLMRYQEWQGRDGA